MTTFPLRLEQPAEREISFPAGWWLVPAIVGGAGIWIVGLSALLF